MDLEQDHGAVAWGHWPAQFRDGTRLEALVRALADPLTLTQKALLELYNNRWLDTAEGQQLDGIGDIVQLPRVIDDVIYVQFFGFVGQTGIVGFGQGRIRRRYETATGGSTRLLDAEYRRLLYWKIAINNGHGTTPEIVAALKQIFNATRVVVRDVGNAKISIFVDRLYVPGDDPILTNPTRWVAKAAGVGIASFTTSTDMPFGFVEQDYYGFGVGIMARRV